MVWGLIKDLKFDYTIQNTRKTKKLHGNQSLTTIKPIPKKHQMLEIAPVA